MDPEFQRVLMRVFAIGGIIAAIGATGVYLVFRSFGESPAFVRSRGPIIFIVLGFVVMCCLILLRLSPEVR